MTQPIFALSDIATQAQAKIQQAFPQLDPVIGIRQNMRQAGIAADVMTIDCRRSGKRMVFIIKDESPAITNYQMTEIEPTSSDEYKTIDTDKLTTDVLYSWMKRYFA